MKCVATTSSRYLGEQVVKLTIISLACIILAGCATQAQRQYRQLETRHQTAIRSVTTCFQPLLETSVAHRLKERFVLDMNEPRIVEKLALKTYVTSEEAKDLLDLSALRKPCHKLALEEFGKIHPEYVVSLARLFAEADADVAKAINKELTIGEGNQRTVDRVNRMQAEFTQIGQRIEAQLNQAHQYELTQRQLATQALQTWSYQQQVLSNQQQLLNATRQPRITNCQYIGSLLHCTQF